MNDLVKTLDPKYLRVECKYTRRGGIDINPIRIYNPKNIRDSCNFREEINKFTRMIRQ